MSWEDDYELRIGKNVVEGVVIAPLKAVPQNSPSQTGQKARKSSNSNGRELIVTANILEYWSLR
jgi:hypothetical protein